MNTAEYINIRTAIVAAGYSDEIDWAQSAKSPTSADDFAGEAIWVILCSGMKEQIARKIKDRVWPALRESKPVRSVFGHLGKAQAIETIWLNKEILLQAFQSANDKVEFCASLPWIGKITKWHLAKNLGVDCAKPDIHLTRLADYYGDTPADLCARLAKATGDRIATVDLVIWRACNLGIIKTRELKVLTTCP